jgi:hypothetical protein
MTIFRWKKKPTGTDAQLPFGLSTHQLDHLSALKETRGFSIYKRLLQDVAEYNGSSLLNESDPHRLYYRQGFISALRDAIKLVDTITEEVERARSANRPDDNGLDTRSFIGSHWFDTARRYANKPDA